MPNQNIENRSGPLKKCRVIELGSTVAGPFCARLLADFGADVIKVEQRDGDAVRSMGKSKDGRSLYSASILRNKRIVGINLRMSKGQEIVKRLCRDADIVIENFRPGTLEKWGLGYDVLSKLNPKLILVRISGYGQTGPYSKKPGYGVVCEAFSGLREITGDPDRPPARVAVSMTDYITGLYAAFGAVMAMYEREDSSKGQVIDAALYESAFSFMEPHIPAYEQLGHIATRSGSRLPGHTPNSLYCTKDNKYIHITAGSQSIFKRLAVLMGQPDLLQNPRFATPLARNSNSDEMDELVSAWTESHSLIDLESMLDQANIPASRIYNMHDIFHDPHYQAREMMVKVSDKKLGEVSVANVVPRLSRTPGAVRWAGHDIAEDTYTVLTNDLLMDEHELQELVESGVVYGSNGKLDKSSN